MIIALKKEKEEANNMSKAIQQLSERNEEMGQLRSSLEEQVAILRREVKAKREGPLTEMWCFGLVTCSVTNYCRFTNSQNCTKKGIG